MKRSCRLRTKTLQGGKNVHAAAQGADARTIAGRTFAGAPRESSFIRTVTVGPGI
jgi:hypothetical protein